MKKGAKQTNLCTIKSSVVENLLQIYEKSPHDARIIYLNTGKKIAERNLVLWEHETGDFELSECEKQYGISITNRLYTRYTKTESVIYKDKRFFLRFKSKKTSRVIQLTWDFFKNFINNWHECEQLNEFIEKLNKRHSWLRFIEENSVFHETALNTFIRNKLYNKNDALRHLLRVPLPIALKLVDGVDSESNKPRLFGYWKKLSSDLINVENLRLDLLRNPLFIDTCRMAHIVGAKINLAWSDNRLRLEHDKYSKLITNTICENITERPLNIRKEFTRFCDKFGYGLLRTNKELYMEGINQAHCVGTYEYSINMGNTAIFHYMGYTGELKYHKFDDDQSKFGFLRSQIILPTQPSLSLGQLKGFKNQSAPDYLRDKIQADLKEYNENILNNLDAIEIDFKRNEVSNYSEDWFANTTQNVNTINIFELLKYVEYKGDDHLQGTQEEIIWQERG